MYLDNEVFDKQLLTEEPSVIREVLSEIFEKGTYQNQTSLSLFLFLTFSVELKSAIATNMPTSGKQFQKSKKRHKKTSLPFQLLSKWCGAVLKAELLCSYS